MTKLLSFPTKRKLSFFLIFLILFYAIGCKYFKVKDTTIEEFVGIEDIGKMHKSFFVHDSKSVYSLSGIDIDSTSINGYLWLASNYHLVDGRSFKYKAHESSILNEVHIYLNDGVQLLEMGKTNILLGDIKGIDIVEKNTGKTTASYIFGGVGIITGAIILIYIIILLTKSSCPYVYVFDGESFVFEGETFGGAIASNLQRDDYMPLPSLNPSSDGMCKIRISNELRERQYTDLAELVVIEHKADQRIFLDKNGRPHVINEVIEPIQAFSYSGQDLMPALQKTDSLVFFFNEEDYSKNGIELKFDKPGKVQQGKLILHGKNTLWFDYQFGEFLEMFGGLYDEYMEEQSQIATEERSRRIIDNDFPLSIYIKESHEWRLVDHIQTIGPLAARDFVIPVDMAGIDGDHVEIKIETGFMFWEVDFAGMDFAIDEDVIVNYLKPVYAMGSGAMDWTEALSHKDQKFMAQEQVGEITEVAYRSLIPSKNHEMTYFLHSSGYYELVRDFKGLPDLVQLNKFKTNGYFSDFSRAQYMKILNKEALVANVKNASN